MAFYHPVSPEFDRADTAIDLVGRKKTLQNKDQIESLQDFENTGRKFNNLSFMDTEGYVTWTPERVTFQN